MTFVNVRSANQRCYLIHFYRDVFREPQNFSCGGPLASGSEALSGPHPAEVQAGQGGILTWRMKHLNAAIRSALPAYLDAFELWNTNLRQIPHSFVPGDLSGLRNGTSDPRIPTFTGS
ncbi:hypothetical protein CGCA056_v010488 [Colletotrichum aenigma]|uniref:uncharacterized protein n=1 Tax=Colletotrichum aenigma TaxID=1215731 RepID=UPI0018730505|nr:uncharacterized protein CGCA056_v010488 [Colletotrichum aenigma]KAF5518234.1 hypothetical protein CGCA056_v010488 [Colletotrichum aenigma]